MLTAVTYDVITATDKALYSALMVLAVPAYLTTLYGGRVVNLQSITTAFKSGMRSYCRLHISLLYICAVIVFRLACSLSERYTVNAHVVRGSPPRMSFLACMRSDCCFRSRQPCQSGGGAAGLLVFYLYLMYTL